jgi:hypothetical protein
MIDGSGSLDCRIFGKRPVRIVRKRGAMTHQSARKAGRQIGAEQVRATTDLGC